MLSFAQKHRRMFFIVKMKAWGSSLIKDFILLSDTHTCIYCLQVKTFGEFGREHVLNDAFGRYEPISFVLLNPRNKIFRVCKECNSRLGKKIDDALATTTIEGIQRFLFDIKSHKDFDTRRYTRNQKVHISTGIYRYS